MNSIYVDTASVYKFDGNVWSLVLANGFPSWTGAAFFANDTSDTILVGRAECFLVGRPDLDETIERLQAYSAAGADCLYAPGISTSEQISAVVKALAPKPINLLVGNAGGLSMAACADLGVRRVSVGGALARAAWGGMLRAAKPLLEAGSFEGFADATPGKVMNQFFAAVSGGRSG